MVVIVYLSHNRCVNNTTITFNNSTSKQKRSRHVDNDVIDKIHFLFSRMVISDYDINHYRMTMKSGLTI